MPDLTPEEFRRLGHQLVEWVAGYREGLADLPVRSPVPPGWVRERLAPELPAAPQPLDALLSAMDRVVVPGSTHWQHPSFFGYFPANASLASLLGELLSGGLGAQGMLWSTSPACTEVEQHLLDQLALAMGLGDAFTFAGGGGGVLQDSASSATLVALLAALHRSSGGAWRERGVDGSEVVYGTAETHSSLAKGVRVAGLGAAALRVVATDGTGAMSADALAAAMAADVDAGRRPVLVCATIGTTGTGAVDPVRKVAAVCAGPGAWVHVDAAWAGAAALCPEFAALFDGIELADSYCADAHKWLLTAFDASMLWTRHGTVLPAALSITPPYLRDAASESGQVVDYRDWQVPLGRRFRALKLWAVLHCLGLDGVRGQVRAHVTWAAELAADVRADPRFELVAPPSLALVCLRLRAGEAATRALLERVNASGHALLTSTVVGGRTAIRVAIGSVGTERRHVRALWEMLAASADPDQTLLDDGGHEAAVAGEEPPGGEPAATRSRR